MSGHEFQSFFPESGEVDMSDTSTNIDETTMAELRELAARLATLVAHPLPDGARCVSAGHGSTSSSTTKHR